MGWIEEKSASISSGSSYSKTNKTNKVTFRLTVNWGLKLLFVFLAMVIMDLTVTSFIWLIIFHSTISYGEEKKTWTLFFEENFLLILSIPSLVSLSFAFIGSLAEKIDDLRIYKRLALFSLDCEVVVISYLILVKQVHNSPSNDLWLVFMVSVLKVLLLVPSVVVVNVLKEKLIKKEVKRFLRLQKRTTRDSNWL